MRQQPIACPHYRETDLLAFLVPLLTSLVSSASKVYASSVTEAVIRITLMHCIAMRVIELALMVSHCDVVT